MAANNSSTTSFERFGERIGKSLVKYLKPIRVALPHFKEQKASIQTIITDETSLDTPKAPAGIVEKIPEKIEEPFKDEIQEEIDALDREMKSVAVPDPEKNSWLDSVLYMIKSCKKSALKLKRKKAVSSYSSAVQARAVSKFQSRGTIINVELGSLQFAHGSGHKKDPQQD